MLPPLFVAPARVIAPTLAIVISLITTGCRDDQTESADGDLSTLVHSLAPQSPPLDVEKASRDLDTLLAIVGLPHSKLSDVLGAHVVTASTSVQVTDGIEVLEELDDVLNLMIDSNARYQLTLDNSNEYGRHATFDGVTLYLRPRYGLYHARTPNSVSEAADIRNEEFGGAYEYLELLATQGELHDHGERTRDGRMVRELAITMAPKKREVTAETLSQRKWRNHIHVTALEANISLDAETGTAVALRMVGSLLFERDHEQYQMHLKAERLISQIGHALPIEIPKDVMKIPPRKRELDERNTLLKSIAPPARQAPTPSARKRAQS